jgi:hypothetical protein
MLKEDEETITRTDVAVDVTPKLVQGNTVVCEIDAGSGAGGKVKGGIIKLQRGNYYQLVFVLQQGDVPGLQFTQGGSNAFWCDMNSCPTASSNNSNNQLSNPTVSPDGLTLTVDADPKPPKNAVYYSLNFNNGGSYDPIIIHD